MRQKIVRIILTLLWGLLISPVLFILAIIGPSIVDFAQLRFYDYPQQILIRFYTEKDLASDQIMDTLIIAGSKMVPLLETEILKKGMPRRAYAIIALGHIGDKDSIPVLEKILQDIDEDEYYRRDALEAIALIDLPAAKIIAPKYLNEKETIYRAARHILSPTPYIWRRTYWDAFFRVHE